MSQFKVKTQAVKGVASDLENCQTTLSSLRESISQVRSSLNFQVSASSQISSSLKTVYNNLGTDAKTLKRMKQTLDSAAQAYEKTEERILNAAEDGEISPKENITIINKNIMVDMLDGGDWQARISDAICALISGGEFSFLDGEKSKDIVDRYDEDDSNNIDKAATIAGAEWKKEGALLNASGSIENEYGTAEGEVTLGSGEVHANAYGGIYTVGEDGSKKLTLGAGAEVGIGVSLFTASGKLSTGNDMLGAYVSGDVTVGKAEAKAGFDAGFTDETGAFNPQLQASASAEALIFEASAAVGGTVLGADVSGNVGVSVGVGAHANVGLKDGVITFDVGAALGVGVSVDFEVDLSGTVEKVGGVISDGWSTLTGWLDI